MKKAATHFEDFFDAVVFLTWSNWKTEPRSNRYHYATRFANRLPTYFFQPNLMDAEIVEEDSGVTGLTIVNCSGTFDDEQSNAIKVYLRKAGVKRPLLWVYNFQFESFLHTSSEWFSVFHATEDFTVRDLTYFTEDQRRQMTRVVPMCDLLVAVSESVRQNYVDRLELKIPAITLANGCDYQFWVMHRAFEFSPGDDGSRVALYQGGVNSRLDFDLLEQLVANMQDWVFSFCGQADERPHMAEEMSGWSRILQMPNVRYHGEVSPDQIAALSKQAVVGLIPFKDVDTIRISLPLKAYEYTACGLPVVSVPIRALEMDPDNFSIAHNAAEFEDAIRALAPTREDPSKVSQRLDSAYKMGYDFRFRELESEVSGLMDSKLRKNKCLNVLMLHDDAFAHIKTIQEHLRAFRTHSRHNYYFLPSSDNPAWKFFEDYRSGGPKSWPQAWDFSVYDAIVWHYGMTAALPDFFSSIVGEKLSQYDGLKILFVQDEYESTHVIWDWIRKTGIHLVMTCVPPQGISYAYPPEHAKGVEFIQTLTGFVPEDEGLDRYIVPMSHRAIRIGYRGRILPFHYGSLGYEKFEIGVKLKELADVRNVAIDIEVDDHKRIYGDSWYHFLGSVRATLGTESGSNVFDFDGTLKPHALAARESGRDFQSYFQEHLKHREGHIHMNQISPKIFESIRLKTALICFEGEYSGVIKPNQHYIPLARDFSNADEVFEKLEDLCYLEELTERAYQDIILSDRYSYRQFVAAFDTIVEQRVKNDAKYEIFSVPIALRKRGEESLKVIVRATPLEYILTDGVLRRPFERRDIEAAMTQGHKEDGVH